MNQSRPARLSGFPLYALIVLLYWLGYAASAFVAAYLAENGFASTYVGTIMAVVNCIGVLSAPLMGNRADRLGSPRRVFMLCALGSGAALALVPACMPYTAITTLPVVLLYFTWAFFCKPMSGLCDGWMLSVIERRGDFSYGKIRYLGSFAYALMCVVYSFAAQRFGSQDIIFYLYAGLNVLLIGACIYARHDDVPAPRREKRARVGVRAALKSYHLVIFLICHCLVSVPMYCSITFIPYKLIELTGATASLGNITALRSAAEIPLLLTSGFLIRKFGLRRSLGGFMILFCAVQILFIRAGGLTAITLAMTLMGAINGGYVACQMRYVHAVTPQNAQTSAVSLCVSVALISAVVGNLIGGVLVDAFGTSAYFLFAMILTAAATALFCISTPLGKKLGFAPPQEL